MLEDLLVEMTSFTFYITLWVTFSRAIKEDQTQTSFSISKEQVNFNDLNIDGDLQITYQIVLLNVQKWLRQDFSWIIKSVDYHYVNISK